MGALSVSAKMEEISLHLRTEVGSSVYYDSHPRDMMVSSVGANIMENINDQNVHHPPKLIIQIRFAYFSS